MQLLGLATAVPAQGLDQADAAVFAHPYNCTTDKQRRLLDRIYAQSGITRRGAALAPDVPAKAPATPANPMGSYYPLPGPGQGDAGPTVAQRMETYQRLALPLAERACHDALQAAGLQAGDIDQLVVVSCTGLAAPGVDLRLIDALPLRRDVGRTMIGFMGCHGALNGLRVTGALAHAAPGTTVLMCCVELCSLHFRYGWDRDRIVANALFADGAAAVVARADASHPDADLQHLASGSIVLPDSSDAMGWSIGDHGFEMMLSPRVPDLIEQHLGPWLTSFLAGHGLTPAEVGTYAVHPGGSRVLDAVERALALAEGAVDDSRAVLAEHGNMSSPTILFVLDRLRRRAAPGPIVALAFGPGLTTEVAILGNAQSSPRNGRTSFRHKA